MTIRWHCLPFESFPPLILYDVLRLRSEVFVVEQNCVFQDIDGLDPSFAGGTGTPEIGGLSVPQGLEVIRGCRGLNVVGGDLVEVAPPYDLSGNTALLGANLLYEMLCVLPGVPVR